MMERTFDAVIESIADVTAFVEEQLEAAGCPMKAVMQIDMAIDELFGNIAHYAYAPETGKATVRVTMEEAPRAAVITFIDSGVAYNPLEVAEPDVTLSAADRPIGGLGIFLVRKTMDDMWYERRDGQNILHIRKRL